MYAAEHWVVRETRYEAGMVLGIGLNMGLGMRLDMGFRQVPMIKVVKQKSSN